MQLTKFTDYSLRILIYLAEHPDRLSTIGEVAELHRIPKHHFVKIAHNLAKLGYIKSVQGKGGGICLNRPAEDINVGKLVRDVEPNFYIVECFDSRNSSCRIVGTCKLRGVLHEALKEFYSVLDNNTLSDLISS